MDALVAEKVMGEPQPTANVPLGIAFTPWHTSASEGGNWYGTTTGYDSGDEPIWMPRPYSTDIGAAWEVVERITGHLSLYVTVGNTASFPSSIHYLKPWVCVIGIHEKPVALIQAKTAPHAICLAALKTVNHNTKENTE